MSAPIDRTADAYRVRVRALAEAVRTRRPDRKARFRGRDAPGSDDLERRPHPRIVDAEISHD